MPNLSNFVVRTHTKTLAPNGGAVNIVYSVEDGAGNVIRSYEGKSWQSFADFQAEVLQVDQQVDNAFRIVYAEVFPNGVFSQTKWNQLGAAMKVTENAAKVN